MTSFSGLENSARSLFSSIPAHPTADGAAFATNRCAMLNDYTHMGTGSSITLECLAVEVEKSVR